MRDFNQAVILGNLTRDPDLRYTPNGQPVASFGVATNRSWTDSEGDKKEQVEYHDIVVWGKLAEICSQYLSKGRKVLVVGRLQTRSWESQDGSKRSKTEIIATDISFVDKVGSASKEVEDEQEKKEDNKKEPEKEEKKKDLKEEKNKEDEEEIDLDDIPF